MQLAPAQLPAHLAKPLAPLYVVHGDDPLLTAEAGDEIRAAARRQGFAEREILVAGQGFRWETLRLAAGNLSLFGEAKLLDLRIPSGKPGKDGTEALVRHAKSPSAGVLTLITLPALDWATRKQAWFQALTDGAVVVELVAPDRARLPAWLAERLARQGQSAPREVLDFLADHVEGNLLAAHQELQKLALLAPPGALSLEAVRSAVLNVARYDVESLRLAVVEGEPGRCARLLDGLAGEGTAPPLVLWALATEIRALATLRAGLDQGQALPGLLKAERVFDDRKRRAVERALPRLTTSRLRSALQLAARIDRMIKGLLPGNPWDEFLTLALRLART